MLSQSAIVEAAVMSFLSQDGADRRAAACTRRLEALIRQIRRLERNNGPRDDPAGTNQTILFAAVCTRHPAISVFLVDLIRVVLFLIDPVECNGGVIDLSSQANSLPLPRCSVPPARMTPAIGPDLAASNWPTPISPPVAATLGRSPVLWWMRS
jgi:hypothetical protein